MVTSLNFENVATLEGLEGLKDTSNLYYCYKYKKIIDRYMYKCLCLISSYVNNGYTSEITLSSEIKLCNKITCKEYIKLNLKNILFLYFKSSVKLPYKKHIYLYKCLKAFLSNKYFNLLGYSLRNNANNGYFKQSKKIKTTIK